MGKLAIAAALILLGGPEAERDVLYHKDGRVIRGFIVSEADGWIKIARLSTGSKGATGGLISAGYRADDIVRIVRMSKAKRDQLLRKYKGFRERRARKAETLEKMKTRRVSFMDKTGLKVTCRHFNVVSTCDDAFVKDVAYYLDEVFTAYRECFEIQRNANKRIDVYILADEPEYLRFQVLRFGGAVKNPALYSPRKNFIAARNLIQREEEARIRKLILKLEREIKDKKKEVSKRETEIRREVLKYKRKLRAEADAARRKVRAGNFANEKKLLREIDKEERAAEGRAERWEKEQKKALDAFRKEADKAIAHNRKIIAHNLQVLADQNKAMFEALFHEGFHAFAVNYLWVRGGKSAVPRWLDEALASYYEMSAVDAGELVHGAPHPFFLGLIRKASQEGKLLPIEDILRADPGKFLVVHRSQAERSTLHYAQSWALGHYIVGHVPREKMQAYVVAVKNGKDSVKAFRKMMEGRSVRQVEAEVRHHLAGLK